VHDAIDPIHRYLQPGRVFHITVQQLKARPAEAMAETQVADEETGMRPGTADRLGKIEYPDVMAPVEQHRHES
jgi:hypothetical protein